MTDETVTVAVCIATRSRPMGLAMLLEALARQQLTLPDGASIDQRVVVVDNDNGHAGLTVAAGFSTALRLTSVHEPRMGISYARNRGIDTAGGDADWYAFVDDDEVPLDTWLAELVTTARRHEASIVMGPVMPRYDTLVPQWVIDAGFHRRPVYREGELLDYARTSNVLVCAQAVLQHSEPFPPSMALTGGEDTYFFARARSEGHTIRWSSAACVSEYVPVSRARLGWLVRREFRRGSTLSVCLRLLSPSPSRALRRAAHGGLQMLVGLVSLGGAVLTGRTGLTRALRRTAFGAGMLVGLTGWQVPEYRQAADDVT